jgi:hypothetical protein
MVINNNIGGMGYLSYLTNADLAAIAAALVPVPAVTLTGRLTATSGVDVTVTSAAGVSSLVSTNGSTVVTIKGVPGTLADLKVGMNVVVNTLNGTATKIAATIPVVAINGTITDITGADITVQPAAVTAAPVTFATDASTVVTLKAVAATVADLKVGMHVIGSTQLAVATKLAATVPVVVISGAVTTINAGTITIKPAAAAAAPIAFTTSATTTVTVKGKAATVADLQVGMTLTGKTELGVATALVATVPVVHVQGTITAINGSQITVQPITGAAVTFTVGAATVIKVKGLASTLAGLLVGQKAVVVTELGVATTFSAT